MAKTDLTFARLRATNELRCTSPAGFNQKLDEWTALEWAGALCGEAGELANLTKKLRRGQKIAVEDIADEIADMVIYADLLAALLKIDLGEAVVRKFNKTSTKEGVSIFLDPDAPSPAPAPATEINPGPHRWGSR